MRINHRRGAATWVGAGKKQVPVLFGARFSAHGSIWRGGVEFQGLVASPPHSIPSPYLAVAGPAVALGVVHPRDWR